MSRHIRQLSSNRVLGICAFVLLPLLAVLIVGRFELRPHHYIGTGVAIVVANYALFSGAAYLIVRVAGGAQRTRILAALIVGALFCAALAFPSIKF